MPSKPRCVHANSIRNFDAGHTALFGGSHGQSPLSLHMKDKITLKTGLSHNRSTNETTVLVLRSGLGNTFIRVVQKDVKIDSCAF